MKFLDSLASFLNGLDGRQRLLVLVLLIVGFFIFLARLVASEDPLFTWLVASVLFIVIYITRHVWRPDEYGRLSLRRWSLLLLFATYQTHPFWHSAIDQVSAYLKGFPAPLPHLLQDLPAAPSAAAQLAMTLLVFSVNYFIRDKTGMTESRGPLSPPLTEPYLRRELSSVGEVLLANLNDIDRETAWSSQQFQPLNALVEVKRQGRKHRAIRELLPAIRSDRRSRTFLVLGDPGSGKSVALRKLARELVAEIPLTGRLPVYVNLKEWTTPTPWNPNDHAPTDKELYSFIENNIIDRGDQYVEDFLTRDVKGTPMFKYLVKQGRFFFVLDSFDEIPQVMNETDDAKWLIEELSKVVYRLLSGGYASRGVLASRLFRRPSPAFDTETILELRPFSDFQIRSCIARSEYYDEATLQKLFSSRADLIPALRNPFTTGLLIAYARRNDTALPPTQVTLYDVYLRTRLAASLEKIERTATSLHPPLREDEILPCATKMALILMNHLGTLEASLDELAAAVASNYGISDKRVLAVADILAFARIGRLGGPAPARRFGFAHRRFAEYLVAMSLSRDANQLDLRAIPDDRPMREALALYCEVAPNKTAVTIANFCWQRVRLLGHEARRRTEKEYRDAIHCLRFLSTAFRGRFSPLSEFRHELGELIVTTVAKVKNILTVKVVVEATGVLAERHLDAAVAGSLRLRNFWISETALRACRHLAEPSPKLITRLRIYFSGIPELEFLQRRSELLFSLGLSDGFAKLKRMCRFRLIDTYFAIGGLGLAVVGDLLALVISVVLVLAMAIFYAVLEFTGAGARSEEELQPPYSVRRELVTQASRCRKLFRSVRVRSGRRRWVLGLKDLFPEFADARWVRVSVWLVLLRVLYIGVAGMWLLSGRSTMTEDVLGIAVVPTWMAFGALLLLAPYYHGWLLLPWFKIHWLRVIGLVVAYGVVVGGSLLGMDRFRDMAGDDLVRAAAIVWTGVQIVAMFVFLGWFATGLVHSLRVRYEDRRRLRRWNRKRVWTREEIAEELAGLATPGGRAVFVEQLEALGVAPTGRWPDIEVPNYGHDAASIKLAQLEERWLGLSNN